MKLKGVLLFFASFYLLGCQTTEGIVISESFLAIRQTRVVLNQTIGEARVFSQNGREMSTHYHDRKFKLLDVTPKTPERLYTKVLILGARRPYNIEVQVHVEQRDPDSKSFHEVGIDKNLSLAQAKVIQQALNQGRDKAQLIDEGLPF